MNKGLIKQIAHLKKFYKHKCSPCSVLWCAFVTLLFELIHQNEQIFFSSHDSKGPRQDPYSLSGVV